MVMLIVQHNCGRGYESTVMALETALSIGAGLVMLQEPFIGNRELVQVRSIFIGHKEIELR